MTPIRVITNLLILGVFAATLGWVMFAASIDDLPTSGDSVGASPRVRRLWHRTPAPVTGPSQRPPYRPYIVDEELGIEYNLRLCECRKDYKDLKGQTGVCRCRGLCPAFVDPAFLTEAKGQQLCSLRELTGYKCYAECEHENAEVKWFATPCGGPNQEDCDPLLHKSKQELAAEAALSAPVKAAPVVKSVPQPAPPKLAPPPPEPPKSTLGYDPKEVIDLRGLQCEMLNGKEQCFFEDAQGRELCPDHVTSAYLSSPTDQWSCQPENAEKFFCTVGCQEGNPEIRWGANEIAWCNSNRGACTPKPSVIPKAQFTVKPWSGKPDPVQACQTRSLAGDKPATIPELTVGMLTHEPKSMRDSLASYEQLGLFDVVEEFLIYVNKRREEVDVELEPYVKKYPGKVRVMGDAHNYGIARGISFLTGNATRPYFLFLERDFQLIEPAMCVYEQLQAGVEILKQKKADVVRYRHKLHPGRPNWAERMFKGKEDDVFKGHQPNLFCNHFYWYPEPHKRWPDKIWPCYDSPQFLCSDSFYCNWTNNPQMWIVEWWNKEYVSKFSSFKSSDPYYDLESYMNWEPNSWNSRKFTVAQSEGLFKHVDRGNIGIF